MIISNLDVIVIGVAAGQKYSKEMSDTKKDQGMGCQHFYISAFADEIR